MSLLLRLGFVMIALADFWGIDMVETEERKMKKREDHVKEQEREHEAASKAHKKPQKKAESKGGGDQEGGKEH